MQFLTIAKRAAETHAHVQATRVRYLRQAGEAGRDTPEGAKLLDMAKNKFFEALGVNTALVAIIGYPNKRNAEAWAYFIATTGETSCVQILIDVDPERGEAARKAGHAVADARLNI